MVIKIEIKSGNRWKEIAENELLKDKNMKIKGDG